MICSCFLESANLQSLTGAPAAKARPDLGDGHTGDSPINPKVPNAGGRTLNPEP
jgi:hypothetical protein